MILFGFFHQVEYVHRLFGYLEHITQKNGSVAARLTLDSSVHVDVSQQRPVTDLSLANLGHI